MLKSLGVAFEAKMVSTHGTPDLLFDYAASGAAHLPGMLAAKTIVPVLGVVVPSKYRKGMDSLLSIVQMPKGISLATLPSAKRLRPIPHEPAGSLTHEPDDIAWCPPRHAGGVIAFGLIGLFISPILAVTLAVRRASL